MARVVSTVKRKGTSAKDDFVCAALPEEIEFRNDNDNIFLCDNKSIWDKYIPIDMPVALDVLSRDLPLQPLVSIQLQNDGIGRLTVLSNGSYCCFVNFDFKKGLVEEAHFEVGRNFQAQGIGRLVVRNQIEFFAAIGVKKFGMKAGMEAGGYTWARMGFVPDSLRSPEFMKTGRDLIMKRYAALRPYLSAEEQGYVGEYYYLREFADMTALADAQFDLGPRLGALFREASAPGSHEAMEKVETLRRSFIRFGADYGSEAWDQVKERALAGRKLPLGQVLLSGTIWKGHLDLGDAAQMKRAADYSGGFKYLRFENI